METAGLQNQGPAYQPMSIGDWLITFIVTVIPLVGLIMLFVWALGDGIHPSKKTFAQAILIITPIFGIIMLFVLAFGGDKNPNKKTFAQAYLIMMVIVIVLLIIFFSVITSMLGSFVGGYQQSV